jgi:excisionase family DNA binding protein
MRVMTNTSDAVWLSRKDLSKRLGVPYKTPAEWATEGTGPRYARFGRHVRYRLSDVIAWENKQFADLCAER